MQRFGPWDTSGAIAAEYAALAPQYEARWARYLSVTTARTLSEIQCKPHDTLLDIGCGTGVLIRQVHEQVRAVGLDLSFAMLQVASEAGAHHLIEGNASILPLIDQSFDAVVSVSSFHYWPDPMAGLAEVRRVLRPEGQFVVTDWCDDFLACRLCDRWLRLTRHSYKQIYGSRECESYLQRAGFRIQRVDRYKVGRLWGIMTVTALSP